MIMSGINRRRAVKIYRDLSHTKFISCSSDFLLKTLERASDLKMLISFLFFVGFVPSGGD
jgi:hypothetical protein